METSLYNNKAASFVVDNSQGVSDGVYRITVKTDALDGEGSTSDFAIQYINSISLYRFSADGEDHGNLSVVANKGFDYYYNDLAPWKDYYGYTEEELVAAAQYNYDTLSKSVALQS